MTVPDLEPNGALMRREIIFVHVPKASGTTVRSLLQRAATDHLVMRDSPEPDQADPKLYELAHKQGRLEDFRKHFNNPRRGILITGHFPAARYWNFFHAESFATFVRDPIDRTLSSYNVSKKRGGESSLAEFSAGHGRNLLSKFFADVDLERFGFIGFVENFDESLLQLERYAGVPLHYETKRNVGDYSALGEDFRTREENRSIVAELNQEDVAFYKKLREMRLGKSCAVGADASVAGGYRGHVSWKKRHVAVGWLTNTMREFIAEVEVVAGGRSIGFVKADRYSEKAKDTGLCRSGVCAFRVDLRTLDPAGPLARSADLTFRARGSNYELEVVPTDPAGDKD